MDDTDDKRGPPDPRTETDMHMVESRGEAVVLSRKLAWTMLGGLLLAGFLAGSVLVGLQTSIAELSSSIDRETERLSNQLSTERRERDRIEARLSTLERSDVRTDQRMINMMETLSRIESRLASFNIPNAPDDSSNPPSQMPAIDE